MIKAFPAVAMNHASSLKSNVIPPLAVMAKAPDKAVAPFLKVRDVAALQTRKSLKTRIVLLATAATMVLSPVLEKSKARTVKLERPPVGKMP